MVSIWYGLVCLMISIPLSKANHCQGSAIYTLTFKAEWTKDSHLDFPPKPHFSPLVGCSHNSSYVMWRPGVNATVGVQRVAELGKTDAINNEMDEQIRLKNALARYQGPGITGGTGTATQADINVNSQYPLVSVITMIAPSPDWFIGVRDYSLCNETTGKWVEKRVKELFPYDSGTDSGRRFRSSDQVTTPREPIFLINNTEEGSFKSDKPINRFGTFTFKKTSESTVEPPTTTAKSMSPKPTTMSTKPTTMSTKPTTMSPKPTTMSPKPTTMSPKPTTMSPKPTTMQIMTNAATPSTKQTTAGACSLANLNIHVFSILIIISSFFMYTEN